MCVCPGVMGGEDSDRKFFLIARTKRCWLTDLPAGWTTDLWLALWVADRLNNWPAGWLTEYIIGEWAASWWDGFDSYWLVDGWRLQTVSQLGNRELGRCGGCVVGDVSGNALLTRLKQHDHPLSFLSVSIYSHALHPKESCRRLYLKDCKSRKKQAILKKTVNNGKCILDSFFCMKLATLEEK